MSGLSFRRGRLRLWLIGGQLGVQRLGGLRQNGRRRACLSFVGEAPWLNLRSLGKEGVVAVEHLGHGRFCPSRSGPNGIYQQIIGRLWRRRWPFRHPTRKVYYDCGEGDAPTNRRLRRPFFDRRGTIRITAANCSGKEPGKISRYAGRLVDRRICRL